MSIKTTNKKFIKEVSYGMYVWQTPDGEFLGDGEGRVMHVFCEEGNLASIKALTDAARSYGFPEGKAVYWSGKRPVTDEEHEEQLTRQKFGLIPDPLDVGALRDEVMERRHYAQNDYND